MHSTWRWRGLLAGGFGDHDSALVKRRRTFRNVSAPCRPPLASMPPPTMGGELVPPREKQEVIVEARSSRHQAPRSGPSLRADPAWIHVPALVGISRTLDSLRSSVSREWRCGLGDLTLLTSPQPRSLWTDQ